MILYTSSSCPLFREDLPLGYYIDIGFELAIKRGKI
jgi:hypothetical protein